MKSYRVALVRPQSDSEFLEPCEPLGPLLLKAALRENGIAAEVFDRELEGDGVQAQIVSYHPDLLVFSVMSADSLPDALRLAVSLRESLPGTALAAGGLFVTTCTQRAAALFPGGTHLLIGEGENTLPRLCRQLAGIPLPDGAPAYRRPAEWPLADRSRLQDYLAIGAPISLRTSRGCPGSCTFCATPALPFPLGRWAARPVEDIADEMAVLSRQYPPAVFNLVDDEFGPLSRVRALTVALRGRGVKAAFALQLRAADLYAAAGKQSLFSELKAGGLCRIFVGVESMNAQTLHYFGKPLPPQATLDALRTARAAGIATHIGYILWHPLSTRESILEEVKTLRAAGFFSVKTALSRLVLFPGTALAKELQMQAHTATWAALPPPLEEWYQTLHTALAPLYRQWVRGATALPRLCGLAHLGAAAQQLAANRVEAALEALDALAYHVMLNPQSANQQTITNTADQVRRELHAAGCPHHCARRDTATV